MSLSSHVPICFRSIGGGAFVLGALALGCSAPEADLSEGAKGKSESQGSDGNLEVEELDGPILSGSSGEGFGGASASPDAATTCVTISSWGSVPTAAAVPGQYGMDSLVSWLNEQSTATASFVPEKPQKVAELLAQTDVVLLQDLSGWKFDPEDILALEQWVSSGGSVFAVSGYTGDGADVALTNALLAFTGMAFSEKGSLDTANSIGQCGYCLDTTHQQGGFLAEHPLSLHVERVGAFGGRSITGDGDAFAVEDELILGMTKKVGEGRVVLFHDDWVTHANQWEETAPMTCTDNVECSDVSPRTTYQVPQFWYNAIRWLAPQAECFGVADSSVIP